MKDCVILAIETSCDDTSAAVVKNGRQVLSNVISSQTDLHRRYGGVVPEIASRKHLELILPVIDQALKEAGTKLADIDAVAVTYGPGLAGALLIGLSAAKGLAFALEKPLVGVHHIEGHIAANYLEHHDLEPPFVCLVVSGGHSHIVYVKDYVSFEVIGRTRDDAAGEAFDKIARAMGMGYPGGPLIDRAAKGGNSKAVEFPRVYFSDGSLDFSFSGVKTAVLNYLNSLEQQSKKPDTADVAASFQKAVVDVLVNNTIAAAERKNESKIVMAGGVAANSLLRAQMLENSLKVGCRLFYPSPVLCTDNAAMIACAAYFRFMSGITADLDLNAVPGLKLGETCG